jgi:cyclohexadieny/prephenate dehydrogenase
MSLLVFVLHPSHPYNLCVANSHDSRMKLKTLAIVGVGLIGGSIGLAAKRRGLCERVVGAGKQQASLDSALERGAIDEGLLDPVKAVGQADLAVFCTPVNLIADQVLATANACAIGTLLTDAGSTKAVIVERLEGRLPAGVEFVGSHPLAGSEKRGPSHASAQLFHDRLTVVTRTPKTDAQAVERTAEFWRALGARVQFLSPEAHDQALALTSHLPHLIAAALAGVLPDDLHGLTATGFRDTTRVAAGDPQLWTAIFEQNREPVLAALARMDERLASLRAALEARDWKTLHVLLDQAKKVCHALGN